MTLERPRRLGVEGLPDAPWGTHLCQFYQTRQDLLDVLVPYFRAGLEDNEACMWITSEPLVKGAALRALRKAVPDLDLRIKSGQLDILSHDEWYVKGGSFDSQRVLNGWVNRMQEALDKGFDGLRLTGNTFWLEPAQWKAFADYEQAVNEVIGKYRMVAVCTYSLDRCNSAEVIDVVRNHQFALIKQHGRWESIASQEHRRAETLRHSEQLYRGLLNTTGAWIARLNRKGERTFVIGPETSSSRDDWEQLLEGKPNDNLVPEDRERLKTLLRSVFETGKPVYAAPLRAKLGQATRHWSSNWEPVRDERGDVKEVQITIFEVTQQKQIEERYYQAQKMDSVGRLASGVAHDFNNLLTVAINYTTSAMQALPADSPVRQDLGEVKDALDHGATLTRQLLAFSRRQPAQVRAVHLGKTVPEMANLLRSLIGEDVQLSLRVAPDLWQVKADPAQIEQVLMNLAVNAREAMPKGGKLTIELSNAHLDGTFSVQHPDIPAGDYVLAAVSDTGVGMTEEVRSHAFEPFYSTKPNGTGLGLATCYGIVRRAGGSISIYSEPNHGTTVRFYLPRAEPAPTDEALAKAPAPAAGGTETVLLVEDDAQLRRLVAMILRQDGYTVLVAANGADALNAARKHPSIIHLLLTDLVMPEMSGTDLAERLRRERPETKVLYMSGYTAGAAAQLGRLGTDAPILEKPFAAGVLRQRVREVLARH